MSKSAEIVALCARVEQDKRAMTPGERRTVWAEPRPEVVVPRSSSPAVERFAREARHLGLVVHQA